MKPNDIKSLSAFIRTFNAVAKIVETQRSRVPLQDVVNSRAFSMERAEKMKGWLARARGDVQPESEEYVQACTVSFLRIDDVSFLLQVWHFFLRISSQAPIPSQTPSCSSRRFGCQGCFRWSAEKQGKSHVFIRAAVFSNHPDNVAFRVFSGWQQATRCKESGPKLERSSVCPPSECGYVLLLYFRVCLFACCSADVVVCLRWILCRWQHSVRWT
jgi:hypothetical protein